MASIGSVIYPYTIALNKTLENMKEKELASNIRVAGKMISSWGSLILFILVIVSGVIGAYIGSKVVKKHILEKEVQVQEKL